MQTDDRFFVGVSVNFRTAWVTKNDCLGSSNTTHFAAHRKNSVDLYGIFELFYPFNPFVVGSTPARPTIKNLKHPVRKYGVLFRLRVAQSKNVTRTCFSRF